jgi:superoxide reductase
MRKLHESSVKCEGDFTCGVNVSEALDKATDLERKHIPVISSPDRVKKGEAFEVRVEVGKLLAHPNKLAHFIEFIELYANDTYLCRVDFTPVCVNPILKATIKLGVVHSGKLRAFERCNLHGTWMSECDIEVTE